MSHERWHAIEKIQVQIAAAGALVFMYVVGWRLFHPGDVDRALVFLPTGSVGSLMTFAFVVWLLAAAVAVVTVSARLEGAVLALLVGVVAGSMRTAPMRHLINRFEDGLSSLMLPLAGDIVCLAVILAVATIIIAVVRLGLRSVLPAWMCPHPLAAPAADKQRKGGPSSAAPDRTGVLFTLARLFAYGSTRPGPKIIAPGRGSDGDKGSDPSAIEQSFAVGAAFGLTLLAGLLLMMVTLRATGSVDRGQIIFSLAISFFLASWAISYFFPIGFSAPYWLAPLVLAIVIYLKSCWIAPDPPLTFSQIGALANILPIDWLGAGCGGAVGGYWLSCRLHELKHFPDPKAG